MSGKLTAWQLQQGLTTTIAIVISMLRRFEKNKAKFLEAAKKAAYERVKTDNARKECGQVACW